MWEENLLITIQPVSRFLYLRHSDTITETSIFNSYTCSVGSFPCSESKSWNSLLPYPSIYLLEEEALKKTMVSIIDYLKR